MYYYVYITTNLANGKRYIGQHTTNNLDDNYIGSGVILKKAIKKYGKDMFTKEILEFAETKEELNLLEKKYIKLYDAANSKNFYNITFGGEGSLGLKWTEDMKTAASIRVREEYKAGKRKPNDISGEKNPMFGRKGKLSPNYGKQLSDEQKQKLSKTVKQQYEHGRIPPMLGKHWSDEVKKKLSDSRKGKGLGENNPNYGNRWDDETRNRMSQTCIKTKCHAGAKKWKSESSKMYRNRKNIRMCYFCSQRASLLSSSDC